MPLAVLFPGQGSIGPGAGRPWVGHPAWAVVDEVEAIANKRWSEEFAAQTGRPPNEREWKSHYYNARSGRDRDWDRHLSEAEQDLDEHVREVEEERAAKSKPSSGGVPSTYTATPVAGRP